MKFFWTNETLQELFLSLHKGQGIRISERITHALNHLFIQQVCTKVPLNSQNSVFQVTDSLYLLRKARFCFSSLEYKININGLSVNSPSYMPSLNGSDVVSHL